MLLFFFELFIFYATFKLFGFNASVIAIVIFYLMKFTYKFVTKKIITKKDTLITLLFITFGGVTIAFNTPSFLQWKLTFVFFSIFIFLSVSNAFFDKNFIEKIFFRSDLPASKKTWNFLNKIWYSTFFLLSLVNIYLIYFGTIEQWVNFKAFGSTVIIVFVAFLTPFYIYCKIPKDEKIKLLKNKSQNNDND